MAVAYKKKKTVGAPPKYKTAAEMQEKIDTYFADCEGELLQDENGPVLDKYGQRLHIYHPGLVCTPGSFYTLPPPQSTPAPAKAPGVCPAGCKPACHVQAFCLSGGDPRMGNPRYANGQLRRRNRARLRAMGGECGICHGRFGPIHYDEPSDAQHPLSFVVDEIKPVSRWREFGYPSARAAAEDWNNLQPAHWFCNAQKGNKTGQNGPKSGKFLRVPKVSDGDW